VLAGVALLVVVAGVIAAKVIIDRRAGPSRQDVQAAILAGSSKYVSGVRTVTCIMPGSWAAGQTFTCYAYGSSGRQLAQVDGTVLPTVASGPQWNEAWEGTQGVTDAPTTPTTTPPAAPSGPAASTSTVQYAYGTVRGQFVSAYVSDVSTEGGGYFGFTLNLTNRGTLAFNCRSLMASIDTTTGTTQTEGPLTGSGGIACPGSSDSIPPLASTSFAFGFSVGSGVPETVVVSPFGTDEASTLEWTVGPTANSGATGSSGNTGNTGNS